MKSTHMRHNRNAGELITATAVAILSLKTNELRVIELKGVQGMSNTEIAAVLHREVTTVKFYTQNIKTKLGVRTLTQAAYLLGKFRGQQAANDDYQFEA